MKTQNPKLQCMDSNKVKLYLKYLVAYDTEGLIEIFKKSLVDGSSITNEFIIQIGRYNDLKQDENMNVVDRELKSIELNRIRLSFIYLIDKVSFQELSIDQIISELLGSKRYRKFLNVTITNQTTNKPISQIPYKNLHVELNLLGMFYDGQHLTPKSLNAITKAINLAEEYFGMPSSKMIKFETGMTINENHFNQYLKPIDEVNKKLNNQINWSYFPIKNGDKLTSEILNELVENINQILEPILGKLS